MSKSADAFRTISEVADWLGVQAHVLRFWESKFTQIKPVKRAGGRRYYRPADMLLLGGIRKLLHTDGLSIKDVQAILRDFGIGHVSQLSHGLDADGPPSEDAGSATATADNGADTDIAPPMAAAAPPARDTNLGDEAQPLAPSETPPPSSAPATHSEWARLSEASVSKASTTNDALEPDSAAGTMPDATPAPLAAEPVASAPENTQMDMLLDTPASPEPASSLTEPPEQQLQSAPAEPDDPTALAAAVEEAPLESAPQDGAAEAPATVHPEPTEAPLERTAVQPDDLASQPDQAPAGETDLPMLEAEPGSDTSPWTDSAVFDGPAADAATDAPNLDAVEKAEAAVPEQDQVSVPFQDQSPAQGLDNAASDAPRQDDVAFGAATAHVPPSPFDDVLILLARTESLPAHVQDEAAVYLDELRAIASRR